jgi:hypothetical protein
MEVNCGPRSEVNVSGTPKPEIQVKVKASAHATADVSDGNSFHPFGCVVNNSENIIKIVTVLQRAH